MEQFKLIKRDGNGYNKIMPIELWHCNSEYIAFQGDRYQCIALSKMLVGIVQKEKVLKYVVRQSANLNKLANELRIKRIESDLIDSKNKLAQLYLSQKEDAEKIFNKYNVELLEYCTFVVEGLYCRIAAKKIKKTKQDMYSSILRMKQIKEIQTFARR